MSGGFLPYTVTVVPVNSVANSYNITLPTSDNYVRGVYLKASNTTYRNSTCTAFLRQ